MCPVAKQSKRTEYKRNKFSFLRRKEETEGRPTWPHSPHSAGNSSKAVARCQCSLFGAVTRCAGKKNRRADGWVRTQYVYRSWPSGVSRLTENVPENSKMAPHANFSLRVLSCNGISLWLNIESVYDTAFLIYPHHTSQTLANIINGQERRRHWRHFDEPRLFIALCNIQNNLEIILLFGTHVGNRWAFHVAKAPAGAIFIATVRRAQKKKPCREAKKN